MEFVFSKYGTLHSVYCTAPAHSNAPTTYWTLYTAHHMFILHLENISLHAANIQNLPELVSRLTWRNVPWTKVNKCLVFIIKGKCCLIYSKKSRSDIFRGIVFDMSQENSVEMFQESFINYIPGKWCLLHFRKMVSDIFQDIGVWYNPGKWCPIGSRKRKSDTFQENRVWYNPGWENDFLYSKG